CAVIAGAALIIARPEELRPHENWDMIAYIGSAMMYDTTDPVQIHDRAYAALKQGVGAIEYRELTRKGYYGDNAADPYYFAQQLTWVSIKPLYVMLVYAFHWMGWVQAAVFISALSWVVIAAILVCWTQRIALSLLLVFCPPIYGMARV